MMGCSSDIVKSELLEICGSHRTSTLQTYDNHSFHGTITTFFFFFFDLYKDFRLFTVFYKYFTEVLQRI